MKLSAKSRYGLKAMYYLAKNNSDKPLSLNILAQYSEVSSSYLEKLLGVLRRKKLIKATRGVLGGYSLAKQASEITVGNIIRALEGDVLKVDCISGKCDNTSCPNKNIFKNLYDEIDAVLEKTTLQNIIDNN